MLTQNEISNLKEARKLIEEYRQNESTNIDLKNKQFEILNQNLMKLGYESLTQFLDYNEKVSIEIYIECVPIDGYCDGCPGNPLPKCKELIHYKGCQTIKDILPKDLNINVVKTLIATNSFRRERRGGGIVINNARINKSILKDCASNHGFYIDGSKVKEFPFDIFWY